MNRIDRLTKKIRGIQGETIAETLIALLVSALALIMLAGAISASSQIILRSRKKLDEYYTKEESMIDLSSGTTVSSSITISQVGGSGISGQSYQIRYHANQTFAKTPVIAYQKTTP